MPNPIPTHKAPTPTGRRLLESTARHIARTGWPTAARLLVYEVSKYVLQVLIGFPS